MKVILLADVKGTGKAGQLVEVSVGHARNMLIPKKMAIEATKENIAELERRKKAAEKKRQEEITAAQSLKAELEKGGLHIKVKAGERGKLFGSVTSGEIAQALREQMGFELDKRKILLDEPIKQQGEKEVEIRLHSEVTARVKVVIE